jgi:hypothetical protein
MADTPFPPLKREPLLEEELPSANPTVRLIKGARIKFAPGHPTGLDRQLFFCAQLLMGGRGRMDREGPSAADVGDVVEKLDRVDEPPARLDPAVELEPDESAAAALQIGSPLDGIVKPQSATGFGA